MLETPHVLVGATIAVKVTNPLLALPIAFASHIVLDSTPHWNPDIHSEVVKNGKISLKSKLVIYSDTILALSLGTVIALSFLPSVSTFLRIMLACFFAVLPDLMGAPFFFKGSKHNFLVKYWIPFKRRVQTEVDPFFGNLTQIIVSIAVLLLDIYLNYLLLSSLNVFSTFSVNNYFISHFNK